MNMCDWNVGGWKEGTPNKISNPTRERRAHILWISTISFRDSVLLKLTRNVIATASILLDYNRNEICVTWTFNWWLRKKNPNAHARAVNIVGKTSSAEGSQTRKVIIRLLWNLHSARCSWFLSFLSRFTTSLVIFCYVNCLGPNEKMEMRWIWIFYEALPVQTSSLTIPALSRQIPWSGQQIPLQFSP